MKDKKRKNQTSVIIALAVTIIFITMLLRFFGAALVVGTSMEPTLHNGTLIISVRPSEKDAITRGDIVIANIEDRKTGKSVRVIKRAVGIPGDRIQIKDGGLYINGEWKKTFERIREPGKAREEISLGKDEYFLLGDNVNTSGDSRMFGPVKKSCITGIYTGGLPW